MRTLQGITQGIGAVKCGCSAAPVRIDGYAPHDFEQWFPEDLSQALKDHFGHYNDGPYGFSVAPRLVYSFLAAFEPDMALTLLSYGFSSLGEAEVFLSWAGFEWIGNGDNYAETKFACLHGIDVNDYLDVIFNKPSPQGKQHSLVMDALYFLNDCASRFARGTLAALISSDAVKLSHVDEIGYELLDMCIDSEHLHTVLKELYRIDDPWDEGPGYTPAEVRAILEKSPDRQNMIRRLRLLKRLGPEVALEVNSLGFLFNFHESFIFSLPPESVIYADKLFSRMKQEATPIRDLITNDVVKILSEAKVDLDFAAPLLFKKETPERIAAMFAGVHTSMTEGWL